MSRLRLSALGAVFGLALALTACAGGDTAGPVALKASLTAAQEVPPNASQGTGSGAVTYNPATKELSWTLTYSGLTGPAGAAHFHGPAAPGANAGVVVPVGAAGMSSPATGKATLTEAQAADLLAGRWYLNIHTAANPGGEIRGQVTR